MKGNFLRTPTPLHTRTHIRANVKAVGRWSVDFSESAASKIHKRSTSGKRRSSIHFYADDYHIPLSGRSRNIVLKNISRTSLLCALIASRSAGPEYDCFIIRSSSRTWKTSDVFFSLSSFYLFLPPFPLLLSRVSYIIVLLPSNRLLELRSFPHRAGFDKQARFFGRSYELAR